jgi:hypothetical protein
LHRITLEDTPAGSAGTGAGHLYLVVRTENALDGQGSVIRGGLQGDGPSASLKIQTGARSESADPYLAGDTEAARHARAITTLVGSGGWATMAAVAEGIHAVGYDYELPLASPIRNHIANSNAAILTVFNGADVDVRTIAGSGYSYACPAPATMAARASAARPCSARPMAARASGSSRRRA